MDILSGGVGVSPTQWDGPSGARADPLIPESTENDPLTTGDLLRSTGLLQEKAGKQYGVMVVWAFGRPIGRTRSSDRPHLLPKIW